MENKHQVHHLTLHVVGIKKSCRKPDRHSFSMGDIAVGHWTNDQIVEEAKKWIEKEMKTTTKAKVGISLHTLSYENGFAVRQFEVFADITYVDVPNKT